MRHQQHSIGVMSGVVVAALLAAACQETPQPTSLAPHRPNFWQVGGGGCPVIKFTGGGRIDPLPPNTMYGKVTFGFNIHGAPDCTVTKGEIEVVHHPSQTKFHVAIHNGVDETGAPVTFSSDEHCIGLEAHARVKHGNGAWHFHSVGMQACDYGEPGSQQPRLSATGPDTFRWGTDGDNGTNDGHGDTGETPLTGGNIQAH